MTDEQALAAAREIGGDHLLDCTMDSCDAECPIYRNAQIIAKHYAPRLQAAEQMAEALRGLDATIQYADAVELCKRLSDPPPESLRQAWRDVIREQINGRVVLAAYQSSKGAK